MDFVNEFVIRGKVLLIRGNDNHPSLRVLSKSGKKETFPLVFCSQKLLKKRGIKPGMHVEAKGVIRTYYVKKEDGGMSRRQAFHATDIKQDKTLCAEKFNIEGKFYSDFAANVYIKGAFLSQDVRDDGWMSILIRTSDNSMDVVKVNMRKLDRQPKYKKNDPICIVGTISTVNKEFGNNRMHYENIIVNDIG